MNDHRNVLKRVAFGLFAFGIFNLVLAFFDMSRGRAFCVGYFVFSIVVGFFSLRGSVKAIRFLTRATVFILVSLIGFTLILPFLAEPAGLIATQIKIYPSLFIKSAFVFIVTLTFFAWCYRELRSAPVLEALKAIHHSTGAPKFVFCFSVAAVVAAGIFLYLGLHGDAAKSAVELARQKLGADYKYVATTFKFQTNGSQHRSTIVVAAYNDHEIRYATVRLNK